MTAILILSILFTTSQASEIACNVIAKGHDHNSYDFTVISATNDSWIIFQACSIESSWCQQMNLYKLSANTNTSLTMTEYTDNTECGTLTVKNIISGEYRLTSTLCIMSNYSLFMGCSNDITVSDTNNYIPYIIPDIDTTFESEISCDIIVSGTLSQTYESIKYYKFNVLDTMKWISFDTCTDTDFYIHRLVIYMFEGRMKLMQSDGLNTNCLKLNVTNIRAGIYFMSIQSMKDGQYTLNMECSNNDNVKTADNYNEYDIYIRSKHHNIGYLHIFGILLIVITVPVIGFSIFYGIWNQKIKKVTKDVVYIQTSQIESQTIVSNDMEEEVTTNNVTSLTQKEYEHDIQLTDNDELIELK